MKLFATIAGLTFVSAQIEYDFPTRTDDAPDFFTTANNAGIFGDVRFDLIMNHGCHCRKLAHFKEPGHGGTPRDELDERCQSFFSQRECLKHTGGACHPWSADGPHGVPSGDRLTYKVNLKITGMMNMGGNDIPTSLGFYDTAEQHCSQEQDACLKEICLTDYDHITGLMNDSLGHADHLFLDNTGCVHARTGSRGGRERICEGSAPNQKWKLDDGNLK